MGIKKNSYVAKLITSQRNKIEFLQKQNVALVWYGGMMFGCTLVLAIGYINIKK